MNSHLEGKIPSKLDILIHPFERLDSLHDHFSSIRVLAISPNNESPSELRAFAWRFPRIRFEHENESGKMPQGKFILFL